MQIRTCLTRGKMSSVFMRYIYDIIYLSHAMQAKCTQNPVYFDL